MQRPTEKLLRAIVTLESQPAGEEIYQWFKRSLTEAHQRLHENIEFNAGRVAELAEIVRNFEEARTNLENIGK